MKRSAKYQRAADKWRRRRLLRGVQFYATTIGGMAKVAKARRLTR